MPIRNQQWFRVKGKGADRKEYTLPLLLDHRPRNLYTKEHQPSHKSHQPGNSLPSPNIRGHLFELFDDYLRFL